jgi:hypothetical protein
LNRTLSDEDSEEIGKGINAASNEWLNGYELGFGLGLSPNGSDTALSGQVRLRYAVRAHEPLGRAEDSAQKPNSNKKIFCFSKHLEVNKISNFKA